MVWAERSDLMVLRVSFSLLILRQAASVTTSPVQECETNKIVCENESTQINCENGLIINICTAVYGRSDGTTCPHPKVSDLSCAVDVVTVLGTHCNGQSQCRIRATNNLAGDPCEGTYKYLEVAYTCKDIDECTSRPDTCNTNAVCTNTPGSFKCTCYPGYRGDGSTCTDIDECTSRPATCNTNAVCTNTLGSFKCTCNPGYRGDGSTCTVTTITTIGPSPPASASTDSISLVLPAVFVIVVVFLIVVISGVICYKRRQLSKSKDQDPHLEAPSSVINPSFTTAVDQDDYIECANPIEGASNAAMPLSSEDNQHNEYFELPTSVRPTRQGNMAIYNEVGEEDYNVLFGGKEQGDYHEYNLPETAQKTQSGPYQDLMKDRPTGTLLKGVEHALNGDNDKIFQPQNKGAPTKRDSHANQDLREDNNSYSSVLRDDGTSTSPVAKNYVPAMNLISKTQTLQDQDEEYSELPSLVSPTHDNGDIYNEVGEQDYNVLFGGKEQGDYHEYNLPECAQKTPSGPYQELLKAGMHGKITEGSSLKGTLVNGNQCALVDAKPKDLHGQKKRGVPNETVDQGYQDLRKDDNNYTSLHLNAKTPTKPENSSAVASMNNSYQALQTSGPDYAILEPNTNDPSPAYTKPGSLSNNDYQSLAGSDDTARGFDQCGVSVKQEASQDNTYQHLIKDYNTPESMNGNTKAMGKDKDNTYDVLQRGPKTSGHPPSNGYDN